MWPGKSMGRLTAPAGARASPAPLTPREIWGSPEGGLSLASAELAEAAPGAEEPV